MAALSGIDAGIGATSIAFSSDLFLRRALERLEEGVHVYTQVEGGRLVHCGWLIERQRKSFLSEVGQFLYLPQDSVVLTDYYTHPAARGKGLYRRSLSRMLHDAANIPGTKQIYICVLADNLPSRHIIEKVGFTYQFSFFTEKTGGKIRLWSNAPPSFTQPAEQS